MIQVLLILHNFDVCTYIKQNVPSHNKSLAIVVICLKYFAYIIRFRGIHITLLQDSLLLGSRRVCDRFSQIVGFQITLSLCRNVINLRHFEIRLHYKLMMY